MAKESIHMLALWYEEIWDLRKIHVCEEQADKSLDLIKIIFVTW